MYFISNSTRATLFCTYAVMILRDFVLLYVTPCARVSVRRVCDVEPAGLSCSVMFTLFLFSVFVALPLSFAVML